MALVEADLPEGILFHIGRTPNVLAWAEWDYVGSGRFDAPARSGKFRVLYAAEQRLAAFVETLQKWRPSIEALAVLESVTSAPGPTPVSEGGIGRIPDDWRLKRGMGMLRLLPNQRWLDLRNHETRESLRNRLAPILHSLGHEDLDLSDVVGRDRRLTQTVALFAFEEGFQGISYTSRFDSNFDCWAIFEGARFTPLGQLPIARDDPNLLEAARRFNLILPSKR